MCMTRLILAGLALALVAPLQAADSGAVQTLKQLVQARQFSEAFSLGEAAAQEHEGDADFDFYYG